MKRIFALSILALAFQFQPANAQTPALEVQRLAPQLVAFAGGDANFAALVNGLALGAPVTLTTPLGNGTVQTFTFTPTGVMSSSQIAQVLETARQALIAKGVATPTAQQLGTIITGGLLTTAPGTTQVNPLVNALVTTTPATTASVVTQSPAAAIQGSMSPAGASAATGGTARGQMSDSPFPRGISDTPTLPVPGTTAPATTATTPAPAATPIAPAATPIAPAVVAPAVRTGDR